MVAKGKVKVLVVDDSAVVRQTLKEILSSDPHLEVSGTASDPYFAAERIKRNVPDVITLDIELPRMDGLTFLKKLMSQRPIPVVVCSKLMGMGSGNAMRALEYGAVDIISKPQLGTKRFLEESKILICDAVKAAAQARLNRIKPVKAVMITPKLTADAVLKKTKRAVSAETTEKIVVMGTSTGGTEALRVFLEAMPEDSPGIVIVQHMPEHFTAAFARRLDGLCRIMVKEAEDQDTVSRGLALVAPGNSHMMLRRSGKGYVVDIKDGPLVCRHRPSVDVLFRSAAQNAGKNAVGVIMTGMGDDGARGMKEMKDAGAFNIAQDEKSCVVFGMPKEAIRLGGVDVVMPLERIPEEVMRLCRAERESGSVSDKKYQEVSL